MKLFRYLMRRLSRNKVTVLGFHKVPTHLDPIAPHEHGINEFVRVIEFVQQYFQIMSLDEAFNALQSQQVKSGGVCITLDDGYVDWDDTVVPTLLARKIPATFFITTCQLNGSPLWHERVRHALLNGSNSCPNIMSDNPSNHLDLTNIEDRIRIGRHFEEFLKYLPVVKREPLIELLEKEAGIDPKEVPRINAEQVKSWHDKGFQIGAHSVDHPILSCCELEQAQREIASPRQQLESIIGEAIRYIAYPNGRQSDFNQTHIQMAREAGYAAAFTTVGGIWTSDSKPFEIPRFTPWGPNTNRMSWQMARNLLSK